MILANQAMCLSRTAFSFVALIALAACQSAPRTAGTIEGKRRIQSTLDRRATAQAKAHRHLKPQGNRSQILFGDLHVHSTFSVDAFMYALPVFGGEGAHPPADACDFARYCSGLDFFSINDHAEGLTPHLWRETIDSIRECNNRAGDDANPDLVAFLGWEWTQTSATPEQHFGHKNIIFPGLADDEIPVRPISSISIETYEQKPPPRVVMRAAAALIRGAGYSAYADVLSSMTRLTDVPECTTDKPSPELPVECRESAATPSELFRKLDEWGFDTLVIPHGLAWGIHAPPGASLATQLTPASHDTDKQRLVEIMSGHGNSEEFRDFATNDPNRCPPPTADYEACCWRAGEIMRRRCGDLAADECERRVEQARRLALSAGVSPDLIFRDTTAEDWLDCDQCRDCFKPAMTLRPMLSAQYGAALSNFTATDSSGRPLRYRWGFIASTDNHAARPGTGYKQYARPIMTDARGIADATSEDRVRRWLGGGQGDPRQPQEAKTTRLFELFDTERKASFMYPGGIVAVHADGRDRTSIWKALKRKEVYGTSGPRILLWFDLLNGNNGLTPMGGESTMSEAPIFEVRAAGAFEQQPGCPADVTNTLSRQRIHELCRDECYNPGSKRHLIEAIEVVRIRPQRHADEAIAPLIEDPWKRFDCAPNSDGCVVRFQDTDFDRARRDTVYYARALQATTPAINGANLRTEIGEDGIAVAMRECHGGYKTAREDDCLAPVQERAWSSPIYVDFKRAEKGEP